MSKELRDLRRVLELDANATPEPWYMRDIDQYAEMYSGDGSPVNRTPENTRLIQEYRTLAPALAAHLKFRIDAAEELARKLDKLRRENGRLEEEIRKLKTEEKDLRKENARLKKALEGLKK